MIQTILLVPWASPLAQSASLLPDGPRSRHPPSRRPASTCEECFHPITRIRPPFQPVFVVLTSQVGGEEVGKRPQLPAVRSADAQAYRSLLWSKARGDYWRYMKNASDLKYGESSG
jgi:hypothetical protein